MEQRTCKYCGTSFGARAAHQLYCSRRCSECARRGRPTIPITKYLPTPEEIAACCAEIQAGWDDETRRKRMGLSPQPEPWMPPVISCDEAGIGPNHENKRNEQE